MWGDDLTLKLSGYVKRSAFRADLTRNLPTYDNNRKTNSFLGCSAY